MPTVSSNQKKDRKKKRRVNVRTPEVMERVQAEVADHYRSSVVEKVRAAGSSLTIDHTTISEFRRKNADQLKDLFVQIVLVARDLGHVPLASLGFDGTRMRANNRKTGTRTPEELRKAKAELEEKFK